MNLSARLRLSVAVEVVVFAALLFGAAGTWRWPAAWWMLAICFGLTIAIARRVIRDDPALMEARLSWPVQRGQPLWDRVVLLTIIGLFPAWLVLMGLDAVRYRWSVMPLWLQVVGGLALAGSFWVSDRVFRANTFLAPVVRIQVERRHAVVSTGPYAVVRHPLYAGALLFLPAMALTLGSWWGVAGSGLLGVLIVVRTALEDRELRRRLPGYADYAARVRWRLIPGVW
jgi:protein-S-isoprenylcysteine O-methyltransferase Ste14